MLGRVREMLLSQQIEFTWQLAEMHRLVTRQRVIVGGGTREEADRAAAAKLAAVARAKAIGEGDGAGGEAGARAHGMQLPPRLVLNANGENARPLRETATNRRVRRAGYIPCFSDSIRLNQPTVLIAMNARRRAPRGGADPRGATARAAKVNASGHPLIGLQPPDVAQFGPRRPGDAAHGRHAERERARAAREWPGVDASCT